MRTAYFDCLEGASGMLLLSCLIDAGAEARAVEAGLRRIFPGLRLRVLRGRAGAFRAARVEVDAPPGPQERSAAELRGLLRRSRLPAAVGRQALAVYRLLAAAESRAHGVPAARAHFHELGRPRSIAGVVGTLLALRELGVDRVAVSRLALGEGRVHGAHGRTPLPAPATVELLKGLPLQAARRPGEGVTPTGAALVRLLARRYGPPPRLTVESAGYGTDGQGRLTRVLIGEGR